MSVSVSPIASDNSHASRPTSPKKAKIGPRSKVQKSLNLPSIENLSSDEMSKLLSQVGMSISVPALPLKNREETPEPSTSKGHGHLKRKRTARKSCVDNELVKKYNLKESIVQLECLSKSEVLMLRNPHSKFGKKHFLAGAEIWHRLWQWDGVGHWVVDCAHDSAGVAEVEASESIEMEVHVTKDSATETVSTTTCSEKEDRSIFFFVNQIVFLKIMRGFLKQKNQIRLMKTIF